MTDNETREQRISRLRAELAELETEEVGEAIEEAADIEEASAEAAEEIAEEAQQHEEQAEEGLEQAEEAAEAVEELVEEAAEDVAEEVAREHPNLSAEEVRSIAEETVNRILEERHGVELTTGNSPSPAEVAVDAAEAAVDGAEVVADEIIPGEGPEPMPTPVTDAIAPDSGHWWYRRRRFLGR